VKWPLIARFFSFCNEGVTQRVGDNKSSCVISRKGCLRAIYVFLSIFKQFALPTI